MSKTFEEILTSLLEEYQQREDADQVIEKALKEECVSKEGAEKIEKVNELLDAFAQKAESLQQAKAEGSNRGVWMERELDTMTEGRSEEEKILLINKVSETAEETINNALTK